jgi:hypothetical protein
VGPAARRQFQPRGHHDKPHQGHNQPTHVQVGEPVLLIEVRPRPPYGDEQQDQTGRDRRHHDPRRAPPPVHRHGEPRHGRERNERCDRPRSQRRQLPRPHLDHSRRHEEHDQGEDAQRAAHTRQYRTQCPAHDHIPGLGRPRVPATVDQPERRHDERGERVHPCPQQEGRMPGMEPVPVHHRGDGEHPGEHGRRKEPESHSMPVSPEQHSEEEHDGGPVAGTHQKHSHLGRDSPGEPGLGLSRVQVERPPGDPEDGQHGDRRDSDHGQDPVISFRRRWTYGSRATHRRPHLCGDESTRARRGSGSDLNRIHAPGGRSSPVGWPTGHRLCGNEGS